MGSDTFVFREIETVQELEELLALRYRVYMDHHVRHFITENTQQIDLDRYDLFARHYGLFRNNTEPAGYIRVASDETSPQSELIQVLLRKYPKLKAGNISQTRSPLPMMAYHPDAANISKVYSELRMAQKKVVEPGRLVISPDYQSLKLIQHIVKSAIAVYFIYFKIQHAWLVCAAHHRRIYEHFGFRIMDDTGECDGFEVPYFALASSPSQVPAPLQERLIEMADEYRNTGKICYQSAHLEAGHNRQSKPSTVHLPVLAVA